MYYIKRITLSATLLFTIYPLLTHLLPESIIFYPIDLIACLFTHSEYQTYRLEICTRNTPHEAFVHTYILRIRIIEKVLKKNILRT